MDNLDREETQSLESIVAGKVERLTAHLKRIAAAAGKDTAMIDGVLSRPTCGVVDYFRGMSEQGITATEFMDVISKYTDLSGIPADDLALVKRYIECLIDLCAPSSK